MTDDNTLEKKVQKPERSRTWEGRLGRRHFRVQWNRENDTARLHFQAPFITNADPDGVGTPFSPDLAVEWERGKGTRAYGKYAERWGELQRGASVRVENALDDLELALAALRREWDKRQESLKSSLGTKKIPSQRVRIEYEIEEIEEPLNEEDPSQDAAEQAKTPLARDARKLQRLEILEALRQGSISLKEAEERLDQL